MASEPSPPHDDRDLLRRFLAGEAEACRAVERWAREIVRFRPYGIPRDEHEDVVQQALGMLWQTCSRADFLLRTGFRPLVRKIVLARCVDCLRRRRNNVELDETLVDGALRPEEILLNDERWSRVQRAIQLLGERCRDVIRGHFLEGIPYAELATRVRLAEATVRVRMFHCMKELRRLVLAED